MEAAAAERREDPACSRRDATDPATVTDAKVTKKAAEYARRPLYLKRPIQAYFDRSREHIGIKDNHLSELWWFARRPARRNCKLDSAKGTEAPPDRLGEIERGWNLSRQRIPQNVPCFLFHGPSVLSGSHPQACFYFIVKVTDRDAGHDGFCRADTSGIRGLT